MRNLNPGRARHWLLLVAGVLLLSGSLPARAVPVFARQTGEACEACHVSFPELTPFGRMFKLNGFTFGGGRASGGPTTAGTLYEVAEGGMPELYHVGSRTYLLSGQNGVVQPAGAGGSGGGSTAASAAGISTSLALA